MKTKHLEDGHAAKQFVCSPTKKNIFLIGDSIRMGYGDITRQILSESAEVFYVADNCRNTQYVITTLNTWANMFTDCGMVDIVQFNCGHWDIARWGGAALPLTSEEEYRRNLQMILEILEKLFPNAEILFATTTTMNPNGVVGTNNRTNTEIARYNAIAKEVCIHKRVDILDLFAVTKEWDSTHYLDYCHFTPSANAILGEIVAKNLESYF